MNQRLMLLRVLSDGPGTTSELAAETGLPLRQVSAVLSRLHSQGRIHRSKYVRTKERGTGAFIYRRLFA